ncbi:MAG TPA: tRNA (adenosine(37)-N6)-threonylcarbamoyltransferase complex transferase subunit TsaD [Caldisericia bacterium]|nr:tRNA (adenosine(37)-N6)-threonylcarbamoyltransferase complex transferase subunit TsaD [Caldisericia bacterium]
MRILGLETSCDDTSASIYDTHTGVLSMVLSSQERFHQKYGGIVPEIASRKHLEVLPWVAEHALSESKTSWSEVDLLAVTHGPGLVGSLLVGVDYAKTLAMILEKPIVAVNHLEGHLLSPLIENSAIPFPFLGIIISGGHTEFILVKNYGKYQKLAETVDDACGEALDKFGKLIGIPYPAGPSIEKLAQKGRTDAFAFPLPKIKKSSLALSFSGLKTSAMLSLQSLGVNPTDQQLANLTASYQNALFHQIVVVCNRILKLYPVKAISLSGGVAANQTLRDLLSQSINLPFYFPSRSLCTDNASMIAFAGYHQYRLKGSDSLRFPVLSRLSIGAVYQETCSEVNE